MSRGFLKHVSNPDRSSPGTRAFAVTPNDTNPLEEVAKALYVGTSGDIVLRPYGQAANVTLANHPIGYVPIACTHVIATGTTATDIVALTD